MGPRTFAREMKSEREKALYLPRFNGAAYFRARDLS